MSVLSPAEQDLFDAAKAALPSWLFSDENDSEELLAAFAKEFASALTAIDNWKDSTYILQAVGYWLDQHARDRGTRRQNGESDPALASRLRIVDDAVNLASVKTAVANALAADGIVGTGVVIELRRVQMRFSRQMGYLSRGFRMGPAGRPDHLVIVLPYGTPAATAGSVTEAVRKVRPAGTVVLVETRGVP